jgi:hypothetical protein
MLRKSIYIAIGAAVLIATIGIVHRRFALQSRQISALDESLARAIRERDEALAKANAQSRELIRLQKVLNDVAPKKDAPYEDAIVAWIGKVHRLNSYLDKHPERRIPQMDLLTAEDWLDVTRQIKLETDYDFRETLAKLREIARWKVSSAISAALEKAIDGNGGVVPSDLQTLASYLPPEVNPAVLQELVLTTSDNGPGLAKDFGKKEPFVVFDRPVDLWDTPLLYFKTGVGTRWVMPEGTPSIQKAVSQYTQTTGASPTAASQLAQYPGIEKIDPSTLDEVFKALTTTPDP